MANHVICADDCERRCTRQRLVRLGRAVVASPCQCGLLAATSRAGIELHVALHEERNQVAERSCLLLRLLRRSEPACAACARPMLAAAPDNAL